MSSQTDPQRHSSQVLDRFRGMSRLHKHPRSANADYRCVPLDAAAEVTADLQERINRTLAYIERVKPHMPELTTRSALDAVVAVLTTNEHSKSDTPDAAR